MVGSKRAFGVAVAVAALMGAPALLHATTIEIGAMSVPNIVVDFDAMPAGATSLVAINAAFPDANLAGLVFDTRVQTDPYNGPNTGGGRALAAANLAGALALFDIGATFQGSNSLTIDLGTTATEFGFEMGDFNTGANAIFRVELFSGAVSQGSLAIALDGTHGPAFVARSGGGAFDRVQIGPIDGFTLGTWVVPALYVQTVPEPTTLLLLGLGLAGLGFARRRLH